MDSAEEELKDKLLKLEQKVMDPRLYGRGEEIWARMVSVRERGRVLQDEIEKAGNGIPQKTEAGIDDEVMKKATKVRKIDGETTPLTDWLEQILEDYSSQLTHLTKELAQLQKDYREWEDGRPGSVNGVGQR